MLLYAALFFGALSAAITLAAFYPGAIRARFWIGLPLAAMLILLVAWNASILAADRDFEIALSVIAVVAAAATRLAMRRWSWLGANLFAAATLASVAYLLYAASITYAVSGDLVYLTASSLLLVLEIAALSLSMSYLFEIVDTVSRSSELVHRSDRSHFPRIAVQVPAYNEPLEVVGETLKALAALDYPDLIVQVVGQQHARPRELGGAQG